MLLLPAGCSPRWPARPGTERNSKAGLAQHSLVFQAVVHKVPVVVRFVDLVHPGAVVGIGAKRVEVAGCGGLSAWWIRVPVGFLKMPVANYGMVLGLAWAWHRASKARF